MKSILEYIFESSLNDLSEEMTDRIIDMCKNENMELVELPKDVEDKYNQIKDLKIIKTFVVKDIKYKDKKVNLNLTLTNDVGSNSYENSVSLTGDHKNDAYIRISKKDDGDIDDESLAHEIRHFYDTLTGQGGDDINGTYEPGKDEHIYDGFLYMMSPTEQNAFTMSFRRWIKKDGKLQKQIKSVNSIDDLESELKKQIADKHNILREKPYKDDNNHYSTDKEVIKDNNVRALLYNPVQFLEYKYYILDSFDSFKKFVEYDEVDTEKRREDDDIAYIINHLAVLDKNKDTKYDLNNLNRLYKIVLSKYNQTLNSYKQILNNYIKK